MIIKQKTKKNTKTDTNTYLLHTLRVINSVGFAKNNTIKMTKNVIFSLKVSP